MTTQLTSTRISKAPLYVADLESNVTEGTLFHIFNTIGPILSIHVCRDKKTHNSLGYAYVNYASVQHAEQALATLNYTEINGKPCRIMWYQRDIQSKSNKACIFVKNLNKSIDNKMFHEIFSVYGEILSCKLVNVAKSNNKSANYGYIQFSDDKSAQNAMKQLNGIIIHNQSLHIEGFEPRQERLKKQEFTNVYVKFIPTTFDESQLKILFETETKGIITKMQFWKRDFGVSACLNFATHSQAILAIKKLNGKTMIDSSKNKTLELYVARAEKRKIRKQEFEKQKRENKINKRIGKITQDANLYIQNLSKEINNKKLQKLFSKFGNIQSVKVIRNYNGESLGFGFVAYYTKESAMKAMRNMSNIFIDGKQLFISIAQKSEDNIYRRNNELNFKSNYENILQKMNLLRYQIDNILMINLKQINDKITFGELNQLNISNQQYMCMLYQEKQRITHEIKTYRLQYKQYELYLIQMQQDDVGHQLLATQLDSDCENENNNNNNSENIIENENKNDVNELNVQLEEMKLCEDKNNVLNRGKLKFRIWLNDRVNLLCYLSVFEDNEYDDVSMIEFFDEYTIENELGINKKIHSKLILKRVDEFKQLMNAFDKLIESNVILKQYKQIFAQNSILTLIDLVNDIKTKQDVINIIKLSYFNSYFSFIAMQIPLNPAPIITILGLNFNVFIKYDL
eukprot:138189_1